MNTHLQYSGLMYVLYIAILFFSKKKVNSAENRIFAGMLIHTILVLIVDIASREFALTYPITAFTEYFFKINVCLLVGYPMIFSYYVLYITSKDYIELVDVKDHPNREYLKKTTIGLLIILFITWIIIMCLPINLHVNGDKFTQTGIAMYFGYLDGAICCISWIIMIHKNKAQRKNKKFIPIYIYIALCVLAVVLQFLIPEICFISVSIGFMTVLIYHTLENPDVHLIKKLNQAKAEAEDANKAKTDFLSSMSHEIRTPLNAIVGFGQALAKEDISGSAKEEVQDILMASNTLLDIVNGILDISKIEANKIEIVNGEYNTKKTLNEVISLINARIGSKPIDFKILIDENLPAVLYGDNMRVKQIMINLLTNAVKYTSEGRIIFQVRATNDKDICKLEVQVADTGMGMTEEDVQKLFTKFQRFDMDKNVNVEGTGLGMAITKGLVELMNGDIKVKSKYGEGTTFIVTFEQKIVSKVLEETKEIEEESQTKTFDASGQKVLVVDDNKINLKVAERLLREYNLTIELVNSGSECIDKILDGNKYDMIFMDIMMPKMSGIETLENLKNIVGFNMPVVALTADVISGMEEKYISKGFDDCLAKPIVEEELYHMLKRFLKENKDGKNSTQQVEVQEQNTSIVETPVVEQPAIETPVVPKTTEVVEQPVAQPAPVVESAPAVEIVSPELTGVDLLKANKVNVDAGLELLKDMEMYDMTLEEFFNELQNKLTDLENYKNEGNMDDYAILAHALKTEARYVGCAELGDIAYEHELAGKDKNQDLVNEKFAELKGEANRVYKVVEKYFNK